MKAPRRVLPHGAGRRGVHPRTEASGSAPRPRPAREGGSGIVYLVGAGPGDPDLLTVKGLRCLQRADVVVHDALVHPALLDEAPAWAERFDVGARKGRSQALRQERIHTLLVSRARAGKVVVRLKGGDPFVFGRGGEEAAACAAAGVAWEVVPGVSSVTAAPAAAGVPVTHRGVAASFAVVTAHRAAGAEAPDWGALAGIDTLVLLMAVARLEEASAALIAAGRDPATPAAVVERATLAEERVVRSSLGGLAAAARAAGVRSPATVVVGPVVDVAVAAAAARHRETAEPAATPPSSATVSAIRA